MSTPSSPNFRISAGFITFIYSTYGLLINAYVLRCFLSSRRFRSAFNIFCTTRTIYNCALCFGFMAWSSICSIIGFLYLPNIFNLTFGQILISAYLASLLTQIVVAINRFCVSFWPINGGQFREKYGLYAGLLFVWSIAIFRTIIGLQPNCGYVFDIDLISWRNEGKCATDIPRKILIFSYFASLIFCNSLNFFTFAKLFHDSKKHLASISSQESAKRQKKRSRMFAQSCAQDFLYIFDLLVAKTVAFLHLSEWLTYVILTLSYLSIHVIDGTIMLAFNKEIHPRIRKQTPTTQIITSTKIRMESL